MIVFYLFYFNTHQKVFINFLYGIHSKQYENITILLVRRYLAF
jgi:hypothetical protein